MSEQLEIKDRSIAEYNGDDYGTNYKNWEFGYENLNQYKYFAMVTDFSKLEHLFITPSQLTYIDNHWMTYSKSGIVCHPNINIFSHSCILLFPFVLL